MLHDEAGAACIPEARVREIIESNAGDYTGSMLEVMDELSAQENRYGSDREGVEGDPASEDFDFTLGSGEVFMPDEADRFFNRSVEEAPELSLDAYAESDLAAREESLRQQ